MSEHGHRDGHVWQPYTRVIPEDDERRQEEHRQRVEAAIARREREAAEYRAYLASGGDASGWPSLWGRLKADYLADAARGKLTARERAVAAEEERLWASGRLEF